MSANAGGRCVWTTNSNGALVLGWNRSPTKDSPRPSGSVPAMHVCPGKLKTRLYVPASVGVNGMDLVPIGSELKGPRVCIVPSGAVTVTV